MHVSLSEESQTIIASRPIWHPGICGTRMVSQGSKTCLLISCKNFSISSCTKGLRHGMHRVTQDVACLVYCQYLRRNWQYTTRMHYLFSECQRVHQLIIIRLR